MATRLRSGEENVSIELVERLLAAGRRQDIIRLARDVSSNGPTKRRQLAACLIARGEVLAAGAFNELITNNAERRSVGIACLDRLVQLSDEDARDLALKIYRAVRDPQRRDLRNHAEALGVRIPWPEVGPNP